MTDPRSSRTYFLVKLRDTVFTFGDAFDEVNLTVLVLIQVQIHCQESNYPPLYLYTNVLAGKNTHSSIDFQCSNV